MPSRDSEGKRLSGARQRKIKAEKLQPYENVETPQIEIPPPPDDVGRLIPWAASMLGRLLAEAYNDRNLKGPERYRLIGQLTAQLGMIRDKAFDQDRITKMARKTGLLPDDTNTELQPTNGLTRPQTARRLRKPGDKPLL